MWMFCARVTGLIKDFNDFNSSAKTSIVRWQVWLRIRSSRGASFHHGLWPMPGPEAGEAGRIPLSLARRSRHGAQS